MRHNYLNNTPLNEAKENYLSHLAANNFTYDTEQIASAQASGRILSKAVYAKICSPHYNASAMDGIAVKAADTYGASENAPVILTEDRYTVVDTGDPVPECCDTVVMVEDVTELENGDVKLFSAVHPWQNVRQVGEDICMGDMIASSHTKVTPSLCGAFLAGGVLDVEVIKKPKVGIIPTGDEIVSPKANPGKGEIIEFNSVIFSSMLADWQAEAKIYDIVRDKKELLKYAVMTAVGECDVVLVMAGSSAGRDDYTSSIITELGQVIYHGIAIKPGKPAVLGNIGKVPVIGLPGYPVSAIVIMQEIVKNVVDLYYKKSSENTETVKARLGKRIVSSLKYQEYVRVTLGRVGNMLTAVPLNRGAGVITSFTKADGVLVVPQHSEGFEAGEEVEVRLLKDLSEIESSLIITGSHDPLIDELSDMLQQSSCGFTVTSSHVGSMGAITALKNKQAHLGCIHLLDTATGKYNESYIEKYFPDGGVRLVKGVGRVQGLMVRKGNPLSIESFKDITKGRYVNRQIGSGTRILCDYLLKENGIDKNDVDGYRNEEYTHTAVAALIAAGNADCGLGIYSAAKMYGLDFIEICIEEYDLLIDEKAYDTYAVQKLLETLESDVFRQRLTQMGGYRFG